MFSLWKVREYTYRDSKKHFFEDIYIKHKQYKMAIDKMKREITLSPRLSKAFGEKLDDLMTQYKKHLDGMR